MRRREFIKTAAGLPLALGVAGRAAGASSGMYIALNNSLIGGKVQWPEFARLAAKIGYPGTDINLQAAMKEGLEPTRALLKELNLKAAVCNLPVQATRDDEAFQKGMETLDEGAAFADAIGCNRMILVMPSGSQVPKEEMWKRMKDRMQQVGAVLAKHHIRLAMENLGPLHIRSRSPYEFIWKTSEMVQFAKECGPNFGLLLDAWHWHHCGATVQDILDAGKERVVTVHVSDAAKLPPEEVRDNARLMPGEGVIDLVGFFQALKKIGYVDNISPEPNGRVPKEMSAEEGAKLGFDTTMAVMRKAGVA